MSVLTACPRAVALDHAEQVLAVVGHRPVIGPFEPGMSMSQSGLNLRLVERHDQAFRIELRRPQELFRLMMSQILVSPARSLLTASGSEIRPLRLDARVELLAERDRARFSDCSPPSMDVRSPESPPASASLVLAQSSPHSWRHRRRVRARRSAPRERGRGGRDAGQRRALPQECSARRGEAPVDVTVHDALLHCSCAAGRWAPAACPLRSVIGGEGVAAPARSWRRPGRWSGWCRRSPTGISLKPRGDAGLDREVLRSRLVVQPETCHSDDVGVLDRAVLLDVGRQAVAARRVVHEVAAPDSARRDRRA